MYDKDGDFGRVRLTIPPKLEQLADYFITVHICGWHRCNDKYRINRLSSDGTHLIFYTTSGMGQLDMDGRTYQLLPDTVMIIKPNTPASYFTPAGGIWEFYWMHFSGRQCVPLVDLICGQTNRTVRMEGCDCVKRVVEDILSARYSDGSAFVRNSEVVSGMLHEIAACVSADSVAESARSQITRDTLSIIHKKYGCGIGLSDISRSLYISREHLIRVFKRDLGVSPHVYLLRYRLEKSKELLRQTSLSVIAVSQMVGFNSHSNFSKQFRSVMGVSPTDFRNSL